MNSLPPSLSPRTAFPAGDDVAQLAEAPPESASFSERNPARSSVDYGTPVNFTAPLESVSDSFPIPRPRSRILDTSISRLRKDSIKDCRTAVRRSNWSAHSIGDELPPAKAHDDAIESTLRDQLGEAQYEPWTDFRYFIANNDLRRLITPESVLRQMRSEKSLGDVQIPEEAGRKISEHAHKLFAILVYVRLGQHILRFLEDGIDDTHLPFVRRNSPNESRKFSLCSSKSQYQPINCMADWDHGDIRDFAKTQWYVLAPVLKFTNEVEHYELEPHCIPPWMEDHECDASDDKGKAVSGGFGSVWKVRIHPAHQRVIEDASLGETGVSSLPTEELECPYPYAALKRLHDINEGCFQSEVAMLKEFRKHPHAHLVKLLATFRWNQKYYLLFPFAESNLREYWRATPSPAFSYDNVSWILQQCKAITSGLYVVHEQRYTHGPFRHNHNEHSRYGRHGDLKAENILWFPGPGSELGRLVIADFGLTDFHKRSTRSEIPAGQITGSPSYEPPELRLDSKISRAYDIWTLGCLYLELLTWLVCGSDILDKFPDVRKEKDSSEPNLIDDNFFTVLSEGSHGALTKRAALRSAVSSWIQDLHEMPRCSNFVHEFLDLIANEMLLVDPSARMNIGQLNGAIQGMILKAKDPLYLTEGVPRIPRDQSQPHHSSLAALKSKGHIFLTTSEGIPLPR